LYIFAAHSFKTLRCTQVSTVAGLVIGGALRIRKAFDDTLSQLGDAEREMAEERRRRQHRSRVSKECDEALLRFIASLQAALDGSFRSIPESVLAIKELRSARAAGQAPPEAEDAEKRLWDKLKVATFSKMVAAVVSFNVLHLVLRVQLHLLGRSSFFLAPGLAPGLEPLTMADRGAFLSLTYNHLLGDGLKGLVAAVDKAAAEVLADCALASKLDCAATCALLGRIREKVHGEGLLQFVVPPEQPSRDVAPEVQRMLDESWDILESPAFAHALAAALDQSSSVLTEQLRATVFACAQSPVARDEAPAVAKPLPSLLVQLKPARTIFATENSRCVHAEATRGLIETTALMDAVFVSADPSVT
jgi:peroxin-3